jgi:hypothetical protein
MRIRRRRSRNSRRRRRYAFNRRRRFNRVRRRMRNRSRRRNRGLWRVRRSGKYSGRGRRGWKRLTRQAGRRGGWRNPRRSRKYRRHKARNRGRRYGRRYGRNPATLSVKNLPSIVMAGFKPAMLINSGVAVAGAVGNAWLSGAIAARLPSALSILKSGPGSYVTGLVTAGLLGGAAATVAPKQAGSLFLGSVIGVVMRAFDEYVKPMLPAISGLGDYLTRTDAMSAQALGDYLTRTDAMSAQALGSYYGGDQYISEELASV